MVQLMRDRFRDEGGGMGTVRLWGQIAGDLVRTALSERTEMTMDSFKAGWWRLTAGLISISIVALAITNLFVEWTGDGSAKFGMATAAILGVVVVFVGLATRKRNPARSSVMIGIGLLPTVMLMSVFWSAPLVAIGTLALAIALIAFVNAMIERSAKPSLGPAQRP
jgi:hypothetical protein